MGIPKFFRYISERYPCLNEKITENQIPEFDNLYLDVNGIIHNCSHPNDVDVSYYISEEDIFKNTFHYIEILFHMIRPQKLFFLAVDGVAPRAKVNQQRGRRFRTAKEVEVQEAKARAKGIQINNNQKFDSNCITPGTVFMSNLNAQLKYFIAYKVTTDKLWQRCKIIFSGSEVPGEGEHKIMDYIRYMKAQPDYNIHTRHCLYGLDADLTMLGLCTHEIHFTLLREEIKNGKKQKKILTPEETKFHLLHLSLLREYINHEFSSLREKLSFPYDLEKIIDDWVLMGFLVGNDFIPNLPNLHIANNALSVLNQVYMDVLPTLEGYINEAGTLNLDRFEKFMEGLSRVDTEHFSEHYADLKYFESKTGRRPNESERHSYKKSDYTSETLDAPSISTVDEEISSLLEITDEEGPEYFRVKHFDEDYAGDDESDSDIYNMEFVQHKRDYYMNKLEHQNIDADFLRSQAEGYVRAIQWNLHYYYNGCCSWSWYYPHHYAPYISDIKDFKDLKLEFELGVPFLPFEQLLAVLPPQSKTLLPSAFQELLTEEQSPIIDYYPMDFRTDLNNKQQEWEAVVLIPFIDEKRLLAAMTPHYGKLSTSEQERNKHGPMCVYSFSEKCLGIYKAPKYFPDVDSHAKIELIHHEDIIVPIEKIVKGLHPNVKLDVYYPGFPTLQYVRHTASLEEAKVKVFEHPSRRESMILHVVPASTEPDLKAVASELLGKIVYVNWPYLTEAQVVAVSNVDTNIKLINQQAGNCPENIVEEDMKSSVAPQWQQQTKDINDFYKSRLGIDLAETKVLVQARPFTGTKYTFDSHGKLSLEKQWSESQQTYAYQVVVRDITVFHVSAPLYNSVHDVFVPGTVCFMLGHPHYGAPGKVLEPAVCERSGRIKVSVTVIPEPCLEAIKRRQPNSGTHYMSGGIAAQRLGISSYLLSKVTGTIYVQQSSGERSLNVGLNLKFNKKNEEIPGYTRKVKGQWLYSIKAVDLVRNYMTKYPSLFERLARNVNKNVLQEEDLFDKGSEELNETMAWLEEHLRGLESQSCDAQTLDVSVVEKLEEEIDAFLQMQASVEKQVLMQVKPNLLLKPGLQLRGLPPDPKSQNFLLDRVCCINQVFTVPLGYKGTIIGIHKSETPSKTMYDVLFDKKFPGRISATESSELRVYRLSANDFLNITYGEKIEQARTGMTELSGKMVDSWRSSPNQEIQSRADATPFSSFRKKSSTLAKDPSTWPKLITRCGSDSSKKANERNRNDRPMPVSETYKFMQQNSQTSGSSERKQPSVESASEFQVLWNELHKKQRTNEVSNSVTSISPGGKYKQIDKDTSENTLQDASAYLKAMLKISDGNTKERSAPPGRPKVSSNTTLHGEKILDTPPLVQQLFDHARQNEKIKDDKSPIWYCSQLLNYYQLTRVGMPRYTYFTDGETNLIRAHILLPDSRVFVGDPSPNHEHAAGSAAKKVYMELNLSTVRPDMKTLFPPPQQWYANRQNNTWSQNVRPPILTVFPPRPQEGPQHYWQYMTNVQQNPGFSHTTMHSSQSKPQPKQQVQSEVKTEMKNSTSFVPLQAQKKSRNVTKKWSTKEAQQSTDEKLQPTGQDKKKELTKKVTKAETVNPSSDERVHVQSSSERLKSAQNVMKPKKSRVAAKFCIPSQAEESQDKSST